ncbi:diguanylate cyclase [Klebsiella pneumoniae]|uniref:diguanylate cyclase n=1 Tax=Klebsiella pneumoniae TaxID=573 RepID=A0A3S4I2E6_KLEPN|nr:diguanylate cyclase [Klebsiella pneumoniae]
MLISDLDHFKRINDSYGHVAGDKVIQFAASVLESHSRVDDAAARIGVRNLLCCWSTPVKKKRKRFAERIRLAVSAGESHLPERMTISMGVYTIYDNSVTAEACVQRADEAMYEAKNNGRNQVIVWHQQGR